MCKEMSINKQYKTYEDAAETFPESIMQPYGEMVQTVGFKAIYLLAEEYGGTTVYIPKKKTIFKDCIAEKIKQEYTGYNVKHLAQKYDYSMKGIRQILKETQKPVK